MDANELMIGDYIQDLAGDLCQVIAIDRQVAQVETLTGVLEGDTTRYLHESEGVHITPEILEKNGFHIIQKDWMRLLIDEDTYVSIFIHDKFNLKISKCIYKCVDANGEVYKDFDKVGWHIQYVHELQHALRLAGINKEIVL